MPILPLALLFGGMWFLEQQEQKQQQQVGRAPSAGATQQPRFAPQAIATVAETGKDGVRRFLPNAVRLSFDDWAVLPLDVTDPAYVGILIGRLVPKGVGQASLNELLTAARQSGHTMLATLSLALSDPSAGEVIVIVGPERVRAFANERGHMAALYIPDTKAAAVGTTHEVSAVDYSQPTTKPKPEPKAVANGTAKHTGDTERPEPAPPESRL